MLYCLNKGFDRQYKNRHEQGAFLVKQESCQF